MNFSFKKYFFPYILLFVFLGIQSIDVLHHCHEDEITEQSDCEWCKNLDNSTLVSVTQYTSIDFQYFLQFQGKFDFKTPVVFLGPIDNKGPPMI